MLQLHGALSGEEVFVVVLGDAQVLEGPHEVRNVSQQLLIRSVLRILRGNGVIIKA